ALAYFISFATLAITPLSILSIVALIPLAVSLLAVAYRFEWSEMALAGLIATYGTCAMRGDWNASLWETQAILTTYWVVFEAFDLLRASRRTPYQMWESAIPPLNAIAFACLSQVKWGVVAPQSIYILATISAACFFTSAMLRLWLRPPSSFDEKD